MMVIISHFEEKVVGVLLCILMLNASLVQLHLMPAAEAHSLAIHIFYGLSSYSA